VAAEARAHEERCDVIAGDREDGGDEQSHPTGLQHEDRHRRRSPARDPRETEDPPGDIAARRARLPRKEGEREATERRHRENDRVQGRALQVSDDQHRRSARQNEGEIG
jgi:hypothetical protein